MEPQRTELSQAIEAFRRGDFDRARQLAEEQLASHPSSPELQHLVGLIDCRTGRVESGVEWLERAARARPDNPQFRLMLVRALIDSGRASDALAIPLPLGSPAGDVALWHARAEAARAAGDEAAAIEAWQKICSARSEDWRTWISLGRSLLAVNRFQEAESAYDRALALAPTQIECLMELGLIYERTNQPERLAALLDEALANGIGKGSLAYLWAVRALREGDAPTARKSLAMTSPADDPGRSNRLMIRIAEAEGRFAEAFAAAEAMNRSAEDYDDWRKRAAAYRQALRETARAVTREWAAKVPRLEPDRRPRPAFLTGFPRSGTTLLDTFLMGHGGVTVIEEKGILHTAAQRIGPIAKLAQCSSSMLEEVRQTYFEILERHLSEGSAGFVIDKEPLNLVMAPLIPAMFGDTPVIFSQRHPCDAVLSAYLQRFRTNLGMASFLNLADAADFYDAAMSVWRATCEAMPLNVYTVTYEKLVRDPEAELRPLLQFLALDWDDRLLNHQETARRRGPLLNTSFDQIVEPLRTAPSGRWRNYEEQLKPVLPILLPWAKRLGYVDLTRPSQVASTLRSAGGCGCAGLEG